jgi:hypothetical protein
MAPILKFDENQTELVEIPVIIVDNQVELISPEFKRLSGDVLRDIAHSMGGIVGYLKVRAHYMLIEEGQHCTHRECWRPAVAGTHRCDSHPLKD